MIRNQYHHEPKKNLDFVRELRSKTTPQEIKLWNRLKDKQCGVKFRRQFPIWNYIVDFACLEEQGWKVLRFYNNEVWYELDAVMDSIYKTLREIP